MGLTSWIGMHVVGGVDLVVGTNDSARTVGAVDIVVASTVAALLGWGALAALERWLGASRRTTRRWQMIALVVLVASLAGPLTADAPASIRWSLVALHTTVGTAIVAALTWPPDRTSCSRARPAREPAER